MQQLTGMDGMFLSVDTPTSTGVMGGLILFDKPKDRQAGTAARVIERIESRLDAIPPFRWVLTGVPIGINNAYWTEVEHVNVPAHVHEVNVAKPGTDREVADLVASIMETPLPKDRPLWDYTVIRGLSGGRLAHLIRMHHGVIEGGTVPTMLDLLSDHPTIEADPKDAPGRRSKVPPKVEVAARGVVGVAAAPLRLLDLQARTA